MASRKATYIDPRVYLLISIFTIGVGLAFVFLYTQTTVPNEMQRTLYLIVASALLPAGVLWTVEHYFLQKPLEHKYESILEQYSKDQLLMEALQCAEKYNFRAISDEREPVVRRVLDRALDDETCREVIIIGSTLNGLFRQGIWFEEFVRTALEKKKQLKLMFTHWDYVTYREKQEDRADGAIAEELKQSLARFLTWGVPRESIRLVRGAPTVFMVIAGNNMILNPYPFGRESVTSLTIWLMNPDPSEPRGLPGTIWHEYYVNHYDIVWNPDRYPRRLNTVSEPISSPLPDDWEQRINGFIGGVMESRQRRAGFGEASG